MRSPANRHLLHIFPSFGVGGIQVRFARLANQFGMKYRHTVVSLDGVTTCASRLNTDLAVELRPVNLRDRNLFRRMIGIRAILREISPDLLLTYNWGAVEWGLANLIFRSCRQVHFEDGFGPEEADRQLRRRVLMRRLVLRRPIKTVVPSRNLERIARDIWRLDPRRIAYVPNGIRVDPIDSATTAAPLATFARKAGDIVIGTIAPLRPEKNIGRLIRAFAKIPNIRTCHLVIVGDGVARSGLEQLAHELGVAERVHFTGHMESPERALTTFDIYAISSDTEQMPLTVLEAMAAGLPVAGVDVGDVKAMLAPANRDLIVAKDDMDGLVASIVSLSTDASSRKSCGRQNRQHAAAEYSEDRMFAAYDQVFSL